jgi:hypothetical protein
MNQPSYETRIRIPAELGPALFALAGGSDIYALKQGILKACELAANSQIDRGNGHGCARV